MATWAYHDSLAAVQLPDFVNAAALQVIETYIGYKIGYSSQEYVEYDLDQPSRILRLPRLPVVEVTSYTTPEQIEIESEKESTTVVRKLPFGLGRTDNKPFPCGKHIVQLSCGYTTETLPEAIKQAATKIRQKLEVGTDIKKLEAGSYQIEAFDNYGQLITLDVKQLLSPFKRVEL